jgi:hypothetical protein
MYVKEMEYTDFNGVTRKEKFYFNLTKAEILDLELGKAGGLTEYIRKIVEAQDTPTIMSLFKSLLLKSYGVKSDDGRRFIKNDQVREEFEQTQAFSDLYMLLALNDEEASKFVNAIVPADMKVSDEQKQQYVKELIPSQPAE